MTTIKQQQELNRKASKLATRYAFGRGKGERVNIVADVSAEDDAAPVEIELNTVRQRRAASEALFWWRCAHRTIAAAAKHAEREEATANAPAFQWKQNRPARGRNNGGNGAAPTAPAY